jgi:hypothetical protein
MVSGRFVLRFFVLSVLGFVALQPALPGLTALMVAPLAVFVEPLQATRRGEVVDFEWQTALRSFHFTQVQFDSLCANFLVVGALVLALQRPVRERLKKLAIAGALVFLFDELHLGVILLHDYREATASEASTAAGTVFWGVVTIAYHLGEQVGTMVVPFLVFLVVMLRQRPAPASGSADSKPGGAPQLTSPR